MVQDGAVFHFASTEIVIVPADDDEAGRCFFPKRCVIFHDQVFAAEPFDGTILVDGDDVLGGFWSDELAAFDAEAELFFPVFADVESHRVDAEFPEVDLGDVFVDDVEFVLSGEEVLVVARDVGAPLRVHQVVEVFCFLLVEDVPAVHSCQSAVCR